MLLITTATGPSDPTRASIPFHIAVNGGSAAGIDTAVAVAGDAAECLKPEVYSDLKGVGVPPLRDLMAAAKEKSITFYV